MKLVIAAATDVGRVRSANEDSFVIDDDAGLLAVADGMGGHQAGEVASATAIAALRSSSPPATPIDAAIVEANAAVFSRALGDPALRGMGTTLTAAVLRRRHPARIGHVGDSRAYLFRDGVLEQLTVDHSVVAELIAAELLTETEAETDPRRSMITRALGIDVDVDVDVVPVDLTPGDRLLFCSDGLTTMLRDRRHRRRCSARETDRDRGRHRARRGRERGRRRRQHHRAASSTWSATTTEPRTRTPEPTRRAAAPPDAARRAGPRARPPTPDPLDPPPMTRAEPAPDRARAGRAAPKRHWWQAAAHGLMPMRSSTRRRIERAAARRDRARHHRRSATCSCSSPTHPTCRPTRG